MRHQRLIHAIRLSSRFVARLGAMAAVVKEKSRRRLGASALRPSISFFDQEMTKGQFDRLVGGGFIGQCANVVDRNAKATLQQVGHCRNIIDTAAQIRHATSWIIAVDANQQRVQCRRSTHRALLDR